MDYLNSTQVFGFILFYKKLPKLIQYLPNKPDLILKRKINNEGGKPAQTPSSFVIFWLNKDLLIIHIYFTFRIEGYIWVASWTSQNIVLTSANNCFKMLEIENESRLFPLSNVSRIFKFMRSFFPHISTNNKEQNLSCIWAQINAHSFEMKILTMSTKLEKKEKQCI